MKIVATDIKFIWGLDVFNIIAPNLWLIIDDLAESSKEWSSQEIIQLFTDWSHHEKVFKTLFSIISFITADV